MYDTVIVKSPEIEYDIVKKIKNYCIKYESLDMSTGEILYTITGGKLEGSFDYRIRIELTDTEWVKEYLIPEKVKKYWHIEVECSLHKLMMNHNCFGGPTDIKKSILYLVRFLENVMQINLPKYYDWELYKIDVSKIFKFRDSNICKKIIENLRNAYYSRRKPIIFDTSIMFSGSTSTNKFYWKGPEFKKHDLKRVKKYIRRNIDLLQGKEDNFDLHQAKLTRLLMDYEKIEEIAMRIIRFECSIKFRKLKELFKNENEKVLVKNLDDNILNSFMENELKKIIREDNSKMEIVRRSDLVIERLNKMCDKRLANTLYGTWTKLVQFGNEMTKSMMSKPTFYRHIKQLEEYGCSWNCTAVNLKQFSIVPEDFSFLNEKYVDNSVAPEVQKIMDELDKLVS